jgi:hypothetical protein
VLQTTSTSPVAQVYEDKSKPKVKDKEKEKDKGGNDKKPVRVSEPGSLIMLAAGFFSALTARRVSRRRD